MITRLRYAKLDPRVWKLPLFTTIDCSPDLAAEYKNQKFLWYVSSMFGFNKFGFGATLPEAIDDYWRSVRSIPAKKKADRDEVQRFREIAKRQLAEAQKKRDS